MIVSESKTFIDQVKLDNERSQFMIKCKCGHTTCMVNVDRTICSHCKHWVYKNKKAEFKYKMLEEMRKKK